MVDKEKELDEKFEANHAKQLICVSILGLNIFDKDVQDRAKLMKDILCKEEESLKEIGRQLHKEKLTRKLELLEEEYGKTEEVMAERSDIELCIECFTLVASFMKNWENTLTWFSTKNPLLGDITPHRLISMGRAAKLLQFIKAQLDENKIG